MTGFEHYSAQARELEEAIVRKGLLLGIDWANEAQVRQIAREALECRLDPDHPECQSTNPVTRARVELFGLAQLMLKLMTQSAGDGIPTHGGPAWKALGRALWLESGKGVADR